jgi:hypothetical protein
LVTNASEPVVVVAVAVGVVVVVPELLLLPSEKIPPGLPHDELFSIAAIIRNAGNSRTIFLSALRRDEVPRMCGSEDIRTPVRQILPPKNRQCFEYHKQYAGTTGKFPIARA